MKFLPIRRHLPILFTPLLILAMSLSPAASSALAVPVAPTAVGTGNLPPLLRTTLADLNASLNLTPAQRIQFAKALAKTQQVIPEMQANRQALVDEAKLELQKDIPDLAKLATDKDNMELANLALKQSARAEWLALYAMLTPDQVAILKNTLAQLLAKEEAFLQLFPGHATPVL